MTSESDTQQTEPLHDKGRRRDIAKQALSVDDFDLGMRDGDPYWLTNFHGRVNTDDMSEMAEKLREDADVLEDAAKKVEVGDWVSEEAAIYIARNSHYGDYDVARWLDQEMPITEEP